MMHNKQTRMSWKQGGIWLGHPKAAQAAAGRERGSAIGWEPRTTKSTRVQGDNSTQEGGREVGRGVGREGREGGG